MVLSPNVANLTAKQTIEELARQHGIIHDRSQLDELGDAMSRLSDDEVHLGVFCINPRKGGF
jgi:hypothetical protein